MKKFITTIFILSAISCYSQNDVDSIKMDYIGDDSIRFIVFIELPYCQLVDSICYSERLDTLSITSYHSEEFPQCDCESCQVWDTFYVERNKYRYIEYTAMARVLCNDGYTEYFIGAVGSYSFADESYICKENKIRYSTFPNPTHENIYINNPNNDFIDYRIYDIYGKCIMEGKGSIHDIDISRLHSGLYIMQLNDRHLHKIIKE